MTRKDKFISIVAILWVITNFTVFVLFGIKNVFFSNIAYIIFLVMILCCKPIMNWLNSK